MAANDFISYDANKNVLTCKDSWNLPHLNPIRNALQALKITPRTQLRIEGHEIKEMDSGGALVLSDWIKELRSKGIKTQFSHFSPEQEKLLALVTENQDREKPIPELKALNNLAALGKYAYQQMQGLQSYLAFIGVLTTEFLRIIAKPKHIRFNAFVNVLYKDGVLALPIIGLLSFMIGVVIAYQMALQLRNYGANGYIVDFLGIAVLREFAPILTAIMVAGRTGSAFTAELGMMKINQEIDALNTMGVTPAELLLLPRIFALFLALPLLSIWADFWGVFGGMIMSGSMLNITAYDFVHRFQHVIKLKTLLIGLGKAPVFALIIASVGCFEGMRVEGSATSVGRNTTRSVVIAIFLIILADAAFSIIFSKLKL